MWKWDRPLHRALRALLFMKSVWVQRLTDLLHVQELVRRGLRFIVLIRED